MAKVRCDCGHSWETRKAVDEIDQLRCSECDTISRDDFTISPEETEGEEAREDGTSTDSPVLSNVKATGLREDIISQIYDLIDRTESTAPPDTVEDAASEVRNEYLQLLELREELDNFEKDIPLAELREIEDYVDTLAERIDAHGDELEQVNNLSETVKDLEHSVGELREERKSLREQVDDLREERARLTTERNRLRDELGELKEVENVYLKGVEESRNDFEITVPCYGCGEPMTMRPGSNMHHEAIELLHEVGWGHIECPPAPAESPPGE